MIDVTPHEWTLFAVVSITAAIVGARHVARRQRRATIASAYLPATLRRPTDLASVFPGAPCRFWVLATAVLFCLGFADSLSHGRGIAQAIRNGIGIGLFFGFGFAFYGCPAAVFGGLLAAHAERKRRPPR